MKFISFYIFLCFSVLGNSLVISAKRISPFTGTRQDSLPDPREAYLFVRGIEREETKGFNPLQTLWSITSYLPEQIIRGVSIASGYSVRLVNNQKFVNTVEDFLFTDDKRFGWYPLVDVTSSFRPRFGINLLFRRYRLETSIGINYADQHKHQIEAIFSYRFKRGETTGRFTLSGLSEYDDDRMFYGIGTRPEKDERSHFLPNYTDPFGTFLQDRQKVQCVLGLRFFSHLEFYWVSYYQQRHIQDSEKSGTALSRSFDMKNLPGLQHRIDQLYNEISVCLDTRNKNAYLSGGIRIEAHMGISRGMNRNQSRFFRRGVDFMGSIPVIQQNRMLTGRLVFDSIYNLTDHIDIPFPEYPRQPSFRGVSRRKTFRTDRFSYVPSIEYQWPLTFNLGGHLFVDGLLVSKTFGKIHLSDAVWAAGIGIDFHGTNEEIARTQFVYGSGGYRVMVSIGIDPQLTDRSHWK